MGGGGVGWGAPEAGVFLYFTYKFKRVLILGGSQWTAITKEKSAFCQLV